MKLRFNTGVNGFEDVGVEFVIFQLNFFRNNKYFNIFIVKNKNNETHNET